eukprot:scaffold1289_cov274-Pinguiococcus_pyrenoidosus.AAC.12
MNLPPFLLARISSASGSKPGAMMPSLTSFFRIFAVSTSTTSETAAKSPKLDIGSAFRARRYARAVGGDGQTRSRRADVLERRCSSDAERSPQFLHQLPGVDRIQQIDVARVAIADLERHARPHGRVDRRRFLVRIAAILEVALMGVRPGDDGSRFPLWIGKEQGVRQRPFTSGQDSSTRPPRSTDSIRTTSGVELIHCAIALS